MKNYNQGVSLATASGSVGTIIASIITLLIDKLSAVSSTNPMLIIALSIITGIAVVAFIAGVVIMALNRGGQSDLAYHVDRLDDFFRQHCEIDSDGSPHVKSYTKPVAVDDDIADHVREAHGVANPTGGDGNHPSSASGNNAGASGDAGSEVPGNAESTRDKE